MSTTTATTDHTATTADNTVNGKTLYQFSPWQNYPSPNIFYTLLLS
jgi:hypothetical protein